MEGGSQNMGNKGRGVGLKLCKTENEKRVGKVNVKMTPPEKAPKKLTPVDPYPSPPNAAQGCGGGGAHSVGTLDPRDP